MGAKYLKSCKYFENFFFQSCNINKTSAANIYYVRCLKILQWCFICRFSVTDSYESASLENIDFCKTHGIKHWSIIHHVKKCALYKNCKRLQNLQHRTNQKPYHFNCWSVLYCNAVHINSEHDHFVTSII